MLTDLIIENPAIPGMFLSFLVVDEIPLPKLVSITAFISIVCRMAKARKQLG